MEAQATFLDPMPMPAQSMAFLLRHLLMRRPMERPDDTRTAAHVIIGLIARLRRGRPDVKNPLHRSRSVHGPHSSA